MIPNREMHAESAAAIAAWLSCDAYVDNGGNYRLQSTGRIAPWNKAAKQVFRGSDELHSVAHLPSEKRAAWLALRLGGGDPIRVQPYDLRAALETILRHERLINLALVDHPDVGGTLTRFTAALVAVIDGWRPDHIPSANVVVFEESRPR